MSVESLDTDPIASYTHGASMVSKPQADQNLRTFLFGYPIARSMAPTLHNSLFKGLRLPWTYSLHETKDISELVPKLKEVDIIGCAITMPFKVDAMSLVDDLTKEARCIGAISTVFFRKARNGRTRSIGTNTDCIGVREAFLQNVEGVVEKSTGKPGLIIGGGGAARSAVYALRKWFGVSKIYMINRLQSEVDAIASSFELQGFDAGILWIGSEEQAHILDAPAIVVGTVPDYPPKEEGEILAKRVTTIFLNKPEKGCVLEMCYQPNQVTTFLTEATKAGWKVVKGTEAMIYQGVAQQCLWAEAPLESFDLKEPKRLIQDALDSGIN